MANSKNLSNVRVNDSVTPRKRHKKLKGNGTKKKNPKDNA